MAPWVALWADSSPLMMPFSSSDPASSDSSSSLSPIHWSAPSPIGSKPPCPDTTSGIWLIPGVHKTDIKQTRQGAQVVFHFVTTPSSQTRAQVNFLSWTPFWRPFCPFFLPYDRPSKGSGLSELLVAQDTVKMQGIFFDTPHQSSFVIFCMFYFGICRRIPSYLREGKPQL